MLVLSRQRDETVMIGDNVEVTIVDIRGDKVRLGIRAPREVSVHRKEIYDAIKRENEAAAGLRPQDLGTPAAPAPPAATGRAPVLRPEEAARHAAAMKVAIDEAKAGMAGGGIPIGSVLARHGQIIGRGHNQRVQHGDAMAHAEIDCLQKAGRQKTYRDCVLYSTLMPCYLCGGAIVQFGIPRVVVADTVNFHGSADLLKAHGVEVIDLHDEQCIEMMRQFIREHPELWHEDIGK